MNSEKNTGFPSGIEKDKVFNNKWLQLMLGGVATCAVAPQPSRPEMADTSADLDPRVNQLALFTVE